MMVRYVPLKIALYCRHMWWTWAVAVGLFTACIGIEFTDPADWGDGSPAHPSNGHWSAISIVLLLWWFANAVGIVAAILADDEDSHFWDYKQAKKCSKFNVRGEQIIAEPRGDELHIYHVSHGVMGKDKTLLRRFDVAEDLEATDRALEFAATKRSELNERKRLERKAKSYVNPEAESLARVINKGGKR